MSAKICRNCGGITNTAVCDWLDSKDDKADYCYAKFVNDEWVRGCSSSIDPSVKSWLNKQLTISNENTLNKEA